QPRPNATALAIGASIALALGAPARAQFCSADVIFGPPLLVQVSTPQRAVNVADLNGDHVPDLLVCAERSIEVCLGTTADGPARFDTPASYLVGPSPTGSAIADLDGDGIPDVVVACDDGVYQFKGVGDGTLL